MGLTDIDRDRVEAVLASRRTEGDLLRRVRQNLLEERQRRAKEDLAEHERLVRGVVAAGGIDLADLERRRQRGIEEARGLLDRQRRTIIDHSGAVAERQRSVAQARAEGLRTEHRLAPIPYAFTTLDTAVAIQEFHRPPPNGEFVDVSVDPITPMHNAVKAFISLDVTPDIRFHIPPLWQPLDLDWVFAFRVTDAVLLNAITFVQALGVDSLYTHGWIFGGGDARISFYTRLDLWSVGPQGQVRRIGTGDSDQGPVRQLHSDWWDILGRMDISLYDLQSTLIDRSFSYVSAGSTVFIIASARLDLDAVDDALCVADFQSGDFQINVPAVFVSTFPPIT